MLTHRDRLKHSFFLFHPSPWIVETLLVCTLIAVATLLQRRLRVLPPTFSPLQMSKLQTSYRFRYEVRCLIELQNRSNLLSMGPIPKRYRHRPNPPSATF